jgi:dienelactone hydrolase
MYPLGGPLNIILPLLLACILPSPGYGRDRRNDVVRNVNSKMEMPAYETLSSWQERRVQLRSQVRASASLFPPRTHTPLNPRYFGKIDEDGYSVETVALETMPGFWLGGNLYRPKDGLKKHPAIVHPHGHWKKGRLEDIPTYSSPRLAANLAKQGFVVFAYDMVGYNDTRQLPHDFGSQQELLWGFNPLAVQTWDSIRVVDFLQSLPDVDPEKIGVTGASGGGTQTFLLTAVDDRVKAAAPVNMVSFLMQGDCICESAPGLRVGTNNVEIVSLFAPKPLLIVSATGDWTKNVPKDEFPAVQSVYRLFGQAQNAEVVQIDAPHNYNRESREAVYAFFNKAFYNRSAAPAEADVRIEPDEKMLAWGNHELPADIQAQAKSRTGILSWWQEEAQRAVSSARRPQLRYWLARVLGVEWPAHVTTIEATNSLSRKGMGEHIPYQFIDGKGDPALYLDSKGIANAMKSATVQGWLQEKRPVLLIDAFQIGTAREPRDRKDSQFLTYNVSDDAARVQDVLTALRWLSARKHGRVEIEAVNSARWWAVFAAALSRVQVHFDFKPDEFKTTDDALITEFYVPGLQLAGGVNTAVQLVSGSRR